MDIQTLKIDLAQKILKTNDESILAKVNDLFIQESEDDWWNELPKEVQDSISEGVRNINEGNLFTHDQVIQEAKSRYGF